MNSDHEKRLRELIIQYGKSKSKLTRHEESIDLDAEEHRIGKLDPIAEGLWADLDRDREAIVSFVRENCGLEGYVHLPQEKHAELVAELEKTKALYKVMIADSCDDDTRIKALAAPHIGDTEKGDPITGEHVCLIEVTERLVARIEAMGKLLDKAPHLADTMLWRKCTDFCPRCAWEKLKKKQ